MPSTLTKYWGAGQKFKFTNDQAVSYTVSRNPTTYNWVPLTKVQAKPPISPGANMLQGGVEFASATIAMEWAELDFAEYQKLQAYHMVPSTMIDAADQGFYGWLVLGGFQWIAGAATQTGKAVAAFVVCRPAPGAVTTINSLATPASSPTASGTTGGSIPTGTTLYYAHTFWSNWGESGISPVRTFTTGTNGALVNLSWTAPTSGYFRKTRIYTASSAAGLVPGATAYVLADVYALWSQTWADVSGLTGLTSQATIPLANYAYTGSFAGAAWQNKV